MTAPKEPSEPQAITAKNLAERLAAARFNKPRFIPLPEGDYIVSIEGAIPPASPGLA
jgi:hypothetical protein